MASELTGKVAIITGAGRGIGAAVAAAYAAAGADLVLASRSRDELQAVAARIARPERTVELVPTDVTRPKQVDALVKHALGAGGRIDVLVNCAAILGPVGRLWEIDLEQWWSALEVDLLGVARCCRAVLPHMVERRQGRIINFSGGGATSPRMFFSAYAAAKAAVVRLTETVAEEVKEFGIGVNAIAPGMVDTRLLDEIEAAGARAGEESRRVRELRAAGHGAVAPEVPAQLAVFLASDQAEGLSGKLISAPHDRWQEWSVADVRRLMAAPWLTLRRIDDHTLAQLPDEEPRTDGLPRLERGGLG